MAKKLPYMELYTGDWRKDPALSLCAPATRGVWIDLLCAMHDDSRSGQLTGTPQQLAILGRCSTAELAQALTDLQTNKAADVTERNGKVTVVNRRMLREHNSRISGRLRQRRYRQQHARDGDVTPAISSSTSSSNSAAQNSPKPPLADDAFERFWNTFPPGRKTKKGKAREAFRRASKKHDAEAIIAAAAEYAASPKGRSQWVQGPEPWLNGECWNDDRKAWQRGDDNGKPNRVGPGQQYDPSDTSDRSL